MNIERLTRIAKKSAALSLVKKRVGAVVYVRGRVLSVGVNKRKTHPKSLSKWSIHAEIDAILGLTRKQLRGAVVCVVRITKSGQLAMSRPCSACSGALYEMGISQVIYSTGDRSMRSEMW